MVPPGMEQSCVYKSHGEWDKVTCGTPNFSVCVYISRCGGVCVGGEGRRGESRENADLMI